MTPRFPTLAVVFGLLLLGKPSPAHAQEDLPYTLDQLVRLIRSQAFPEARLLELVRESCLGFRPTSRAVVDSLLDAGGSQNLIESLQRGVCVKLTRVSVVPAEVDLTVGASRILRAEAMLEPDSVLIPNVPFEWLSEDTAVADVTSGLVLGKAPGEARIVARTPNGEVGAARVRVTETSGGDQLPAAEDTSEFVASRKSVATATALGVVVPGGGEFYVGSPVKGAVVLAGAAAALAAGYLITSQDTLALTREAPLPNCDTPGRCVYDPVSTRAEIEERRNIVVGAAVAGAFWLYGLVDGIRNAKKSRPPSPSESATDPLGLSFDVAPRGGIRLDNDGGVELTLVRVRW